ncbi:BCCT family transporter, partial [Francisella tularensis subsp. holarctica]|nr:BCCT family transporter [Francisella tularensis subsp. holarctica]
MCIFVCICLILMFIRFGDIKLGQDHELPEYKNLSWFAMLFAAGMGIGLMFYG